MVDKCGSLGFFYSTLMTHRFAHTITRLEPATNISQIRAPLQLQLKNTPHHESRRDVVHHTSGTKLQTHCVSHIGIPHNFTGEVWWHAGEFTASSTTFISSFCFNLGNILKISNESGAKIVHSTCGDIFPCPWKDPCFLHGVWATFSEFD